MGNVFLVISPDNVSCLDLVVASNRGQKKTRRGGTWPGLNFQPVEWLIELKNQKRNKLVMKYTLETGLGN